MGRLEKYIRQYHEVIYNTSHTMATVEDNFDKILALLFGSTRNCSKILQFCSWRNMEVDCAKLFKFVPTDLGLCCSFNLDPFTMRDTVRTLMRTSFDKLSKLQSAGFQN